MSPLRSARPNSFLLLVILLFCPYSNAQIPNVTSATSTPISGAGHDYFKMLNETVDPATGSVSLRLDVQIPPGRQLTVPFAFAYDSSSSFLGANPVSPSQGKWLTNVNVMSAGGWSYTVPHMSRVVSTYTTSLATGYCHITTGYVFWDPSGGRHSLSMAHFLADPNSYPVCNYAQINGGWYEQDTGGDAIVVSGLNNYVSGGVGSSLSGSDGNQYVAQPDGTTYAFNSGWCFQSLSNGIDSLASFIEDRNGNRITITPTRTSSACDGFYATDTLGRTVISASQFGVTGGTVSVSGLSQPYTVTWGSITWSGASIAGTLLNVDQYCGSTLPSWPSGSASRITAITLPNGKQYTFSYDSTYGLLSKITYPTGGYVSYSWGINSNSASSYWSHNAPGNPSTGTCFYSHDTPAILHRYISFDGTTIAQQQDFSYSTTGWSNSGVWGSKQTTVTNHDLIRGIVAQTIHAYSSISAPTVPDEFYSQANQIPVEQTVTYKDFNNATLQTATKRWFDQYQLACQLMTLDSGQITGAWYTYSPHGAQVTDKKEYDFGLVSSSSTCQNSSTAPTGITPTRETVTSYQSFPNTPIYTFGPSIFDRPCSVIAYGNASRIAESDTFYDGSGGGTPCATATTQALPGTGSYTSHDEVLYGTAASVARGNVTKTIRKCLQSCTDSTATYTYDETGQILTSVDACGNATCNDMTGTNHTTTYAYADNYDSNPSSSTNALLTQITDALGHTSSLKYAYSDSQLISSTDANGKITSYLYADSLRRPTEIDYTDGGKTTISYNDTAPSPSVTTTRLITTSPSTLNLSTTTIMDGTGHIIQTQLTTDPDGTTYTDTTFDGFGRVRTQSNPHRSTSSSTDGTTTNFYDAVGRSCLVVPPDGTLPTGNSCPTSQPSNTVFTTYSGNTTTVTDQAGKSRKSVTDGLGRLIQVFEDPAGLSYETDYTYDALNNLLTVNQKGGSTNSANWRTRTFTYNSLSQLLTATNPESGTITYTYDNNSNIATKIAPAPNQTGSATVTTTFSYDALNRLTQKTYSDGTTPTTIYRYDETAPWGWTLSNPVGRKTTEYTSGSQMLTANLFSYDSMGRPLISEQCQPQNCAAAPSLLTTYTYDLAGNMATFTDGVGETYTQTFNGAGRVTQINSSWVDSQHPAIMVSGILYNPAGAATKMAYGNGLTETAAFNNRLRPCRYNVNSSNAVLSACADAIPSGNVQDFNYGFGTANNGNVASWSATGNQSFTRTFGYDPLNRLSTFGDSASGQPCKGLSWTYDAWGNRTDQTVTAGTCNTFHAGVGTNNRLISPYQYDAAGNMTHDASHNYTYDAENQLIQVDGGSTAVYVYDASGRRVQKSVGGAITNYIFDLNGQVISEASPSTWLNVYLRLNGKLFAQYTLGSPRTEFIHTDHLGSTRLVTSFVPGTPPTYSVYDNMDYLPFGEQIAGSSGTSHKLTGKERDTESGLDEFGARYYSSALGRFMIPDWSAYPVPVPFADLGNPQTLNLYGYVRNNPTSLIDPNGHCWGWIQWACNGIQRAWYGVTSDFGFVTHAQFKNLSAERTAARRQWLTNNNVVTPDKNGNTVDWSKASDKQVNQGFEGATETLAMGPFMFRLIHGQDTILKNARLGQIRQMSTQDIINSLNDPSEFQMAIKADGTVMNGNTRLFVLQERGLDINNLGLKPVVLVPGANEPDFGDETPHNSWEKPPDN